MLDYQSNRLDYGTLLCPPAGYVLDQAVATTYSLDLNALLAIPVALFYAHTLEGDLSGERLALLEAVRQLKGKVTLYHQSGKIQVPAHYNRLFAYLEDCLVPVVPESPYQSFHPKVWVIRFVPEKKRQPVRFRLLVLSRNLTFDRSWDLAVNLEGGVTDTRKKNNAPLVDFVKSLLEKGGFEGSKGFLQQLAKVDFIPPQGFAKVRFQPMGIPGYQEGIPNHGADHLVVLSPFLQDKPLQQLISQDPCEAWLFSRYEELNGVSEKTLAKYRCHHLNHSVVEGERALEVEGDWDNQDLHAKLFVQTRDGFSHWLLGSANATNPGTGTNVEFMLEISGNGPAILGPRLVDTLLGEDHKKGVFVPYDRPAEISTDPAKHALKEQLRVLENRLVNTQPRGELAIAENGVNHDLLLFWNLGPEDLGEFRVTVFPLGQEKLGQALPGTADSHLRFENLAMVDISRFVGVKIGHPGLLEERRFLLNIDIELPEERLTRIFTLLLQNQERFFDYLRFLLAQSPGKETLLPPEEPNRPTPRDFGALFSVGAVYEDLLVAASRSPGKLKAVDDVINRLQAETEGSSLVPPEFLELWEHFRGYIPDAAN